MIATLPLLFAAPAAGAAGPDVLAEMERAQQDMFNAVTPVIEGTMTRRMLTYPAERAVALE